MIVCKLNERFYQLSSLYNYIKTKWHIETDPKTLEHWEITTVNGWKMLSKNLNKFRSRRRRCRRRRHLCRPLELRTGEKLAKPKTKQKTKKMRWNVFQVVCCAKLTKVVAAVTYSRWVGIIISMHFMKNFSKKLFSLFLFFIFFNYYKHNPTMLLYIMLYNWVQIR